MSDPKYFCVYSSKNASILFVVALMAALGASSQATSDAVLAAARDARAQLHQVSPFATIDATRQNIPDDDSDGVGNGQPFSDSAPSPRSAAAESATSAAGDEACGWCRHLRMPIRINYQEAVTDMPRLELLLNATVPVIITGVPEVQRARAAWREIVHSAAEDVGSGWGHLHALQTVWKTVSMADRATGFAPFSGFGPPDDSGDCSDRRLEAGSELRFDTPAAFFEMVEGGEDGPLGPDALERGGHNGWYAAFVCNSDAVTEVLQEQLSPAPSLISSLSFPSDRGQSWVYTGFAASDEASRVAATGRHRDATQSWTSWHSQVSGSKQWELAAPPPCEHRCPQLRFSVRAGDLFVFSADEWYHTTSLANTGSVADDEVSVDYAIEVALPSDENWLLLLRSIAPSLPPAAGQALLEGNNEALSEYVAARVARHGATWSPLDMTIDDFREWAWEQYGPAAESEL